MARRFNFESRSGRNLLPGTLATLGAVSLSVAAVAADVQAGIHDGRKRSDRADVVSNIRPGTHAIFTVPGYHTNGRVIGKNLDRHFAHMGTTHYAVHPERGFSLDSIREEWLKARAQDGHRPAKIFAMSMGALLVANLFSDKEFRKEFGQIDALVIDSGLSGPKDPYPSTKALMLAAAVLPATYTTGKFFSFVTSRELDKEIDHAPEVLESEAKEHILSSTKTSFDAAKAQISFMRHNDVANMDLTELGSEIGGQIIYLESPRDDVLDTGRSSQQFSNALGRSVELWTDTRRALSTHATGPERPQGPIDALQDQNHDEYRIRCLQPKFGKAASGLWLPETA